MDDTRQALAPPASNRSWRRFSLKALLCCVTINCLWLGYWASKAYQQRRAVAAILEIGGTVTYEHQDQSGVPWEKKTMPAPSWLEELFGVDYFRDVTQVSLHHVPARDSDLAWLTNLDGLEYLLIEQTKITDDGLTHLQPHDNLRDLHLIGLQISDAGLAHIGNLTGLENLFVSDCLRITDSGLKHIAQLTNLRQLSFEGTAVTDRAIQEIARLGNLECLSLARTQFTDDGARQLAGFKKLYWLRVSRGQLTDAGKAQLQRAFRDRELPPLRIDETLP